MKKYPIECPNTVDDKGFTVGDTCWLKWAPYLEEPKVTGPFIITAILYTSQNVIAYYTSEDELWSWIDWAECQSCCIDYLYPKKPD